MFKKIAGEFKDFVMRGNVVDLAVGIIIGGAFGKIVSSLVNDVLMPPIGMLLGKVDFSDLVLRLSAPIEGVKPVTIRYGAFINTIVDFLIVAVAIFFMIRALNNLKKKSPPPPAKAPETKECPECFSVINIKAKKCPNCTSVLK